MKAETPHWVSADMLFVEKLLCTAFLEHEVLSQRTQEKYYTFPPLAMHGGAMPCILANNEVQD